MKKLEECNWKAFCLEQLFQIKIGKNIDKICADTTGNEAYITRTEFNNGLVGFIKGDSALKNEDFPVITIGNETAKPFVQNFPFFTGTKVNIMVPKVKMSVPVLKFIATSLDKHRRNFSYSFTANSTRLKELQIMLPAVSEEEPDYAFMEEYMREVERQQKEKYKAYIQKRIEELGDVEKFDNKKWKPFKLIKLFDPNKGNQTDMNSLQDGDVPLVSARKVNNGLKSFVETQNLYQGHCVTLNNDGDGGAGLAYYQPFDFALDSHVTALYPKQELSKHIQVFLSRCISMQEEFFGHGHSINSNRLNSFTIMLPVNSKGEPDYVFMENYMKRKEMEMLKRYVDYIKL